MFREATTVACPENKYFKSFLHVTWLPITAKKKLIYFTLRLDWSPMENFSEKPVLFSKFFLIYATRRCFSTVMFNFRATFYDWLPKLVLKLDGHEFYNGCQLVWARCFLCCCAAVNKINFLLFWYRGKEFRICSWPNFSRQKPTDKRFIRL